MEFWLPELRSAASQVLDNGFPAALAWGPALVTLYNDGFAAILGDRPDCLGRSFAELWGEGWREIEPHVAVALAGRSTVVEDFPLPGPRSDGEHACFTFSYSPVRGADGTVLGMIDTAVETTAAVRARQRLAVREARTRTLVEGIAQAVWETDAQGLVTTDSSTWRAATGTLVEERLGSDWMDAVHADDRAEAQRRWHEALLHRHDMDIEVRLRGPGDEWRWTNVRAAPLLDEHGTVLKWVGMNIDVHARRQAEAALRESEERFREFGDASQGVLWIRDAETFQWDYLTPAFEAIYGLDRASALHGDNMAGWLELILPEDRERALENIRRVRIGERVTFDYRIRRPSDGEIRHLRTTDFPIRDDRGRVVRIGGIGHDITELASTESALAAAEQRQRALVEGIPQLVWRAVDGGLWTWASPQWTAYTGQADEDSHGWKWLEAVHPDDHDIARRAWAAALETGGFSVEYRIRNVADGSCRWFQTRATAVRGADGAIIEWLGTSTDVDELRSLQSRHQLLVAELQHRVRNILTVVRSVFSRTAEAGGDLEDVADHFKGRLDSLARTQVIVTQRGNGLVDLENLIREELLSVGIADSPTIQLDGPEVELSSKTAESLGLAIHELTTNAVKYGAFSVKGGRLCVSWSVNMGCGGNALLNLTWVEQGVPAVPVKPARKGFGSELIEEALPYRLGAETKLEFRGGGVRCTISVPLPDEGGGVAAGERR